MTKKMTGIALIIFGIISFGSGFYLYSSSKNDKEITPSSYPTANRHL